MSRNGRVFSSAQAAVHATAAAWWLGLTLLGVFGDCRPRDIDGQCGMGLMFTAILGVLGALVLLVSSAGVRARGNPQLRHAGAAAFLAGVAAVILCVAVGSRLTHSATWRGAVVEAMNYALIAAFLAAPGVYAVVLAVVAAFAERLRRTDRVGPWWPCAAGAAAGATLGFAVGLRWTYSPDGLAWMAMGGASTGAAVALVFCVSAILGVPPIKRQGDDGHMRDAI